MPNGDDAVAAGMDKVLGTADRRLGYDEINKTRDYIAQRTSAVVPVASGGTGATTAAAARTNLGLGAAATEAVVPVAKGGTGGSTAATARAGLGLGSLAVLSSVDWDDVSGKPTLVALSYLNQRIAAGATVPIYSAGGAATSGYTIAYINGDGRVSKGASSERFKKYISEIDPDSLGDIWPQLQRFQMREGDGTWKYGYIAERLAEDDDTERFVVYETDSDGVLVLDGGGNRVPESIDFIGLLLAQVAQDHQTILKLSARLDALEAR